jgi:hypothetical protein
MIIYFLTAKEKISEQKKLLKSNFIGNIVLLPNCHFWSSSLGKGIIMMFGLALMMFSLSNFRKRFIFFSKVYY